METHIFKKGKRWVIAKDAFKAKRESGTLSSKPRLLPMAANALRMSAERYQNVCRPLM